jgi:putative protease
MVGYIRELAEAGVTSFKIEGRMKSEFYAAVVTNAYRIALDAYAADPGGYAHDACLLSELERVSHRAYDTGYYFRPPSADRLVCADEVNTREAAFVGTAVSFDADKGTAWFTLRNKVTRADSLRLLSPGRLSRPFAAQGLVDRDGIPAASVTRPGDVFGIVCADTVKPGDVLFR